ncbi:PAS domain S-box protein [Halogeometricum luteum]|uniref:histidine kinase n=1 Tax=Halogeometricum luteum TaxID=2950537 RepID=A0ABU2G338_9EURY|nr:PAS domain S-box protein [Halogeometricum sp. S3BR5-2]MDS0295197.1 PAS domain S-box protein [Halogeometricum sp. S3BR5-2]
MRQGEVSDASGGREAIYEVFADRSQRPSEATRRALEIGAEHLGVEVGFLTRIEDGTQSIELVSGPHPTVRLGAACPLEEAYCSRTVRLSGPMSVQNAGSSDAVDPSAYERFELGSYVGTAVAVDGELYGTVCFADADPREEPFSESEELFVELLGHLVSRALERQRYERRLERRAERLAAEAERLENITQTTFDVIYRIDMQTNFTYVSSAAERVVGYDSGELTGASFADYIADASLPTVMDAFQRVYAGESVQNVQIGFDAKDGSVVVLEINVRPVFEGDEVVEMQGVARDVTERVRQEEMLRTRNRAIEDSQLGIVITELADDGERAVFTNRAFETLTGYAREEVDRSPRELLAGKRTSAAVTAEFERALANRESASAELVSYRKDGSPYWDSVSLSPVHGDGGAVTHVVAFHRDVTERERTRRLVGLFNRVFRHNFRNEMNLVLGHADLLSSLDATDRIEEVRRSADVIHRTAESLLDFSRRLRELERYADRDRDPVRIDPRSLLSTVRETCEQRFPEVTLHTTVATDRSVCAGDELGQALLELVSNAAEHNDPPVAVTVSVDDAGDRVEVRLEDDGAGILPGEVAFIESGRETALDHGSGLGLWFVNWVVTWYGGSFQIGPGPTGTGTVATLRLPALDADESVDEVAAPPTPLFQ